jgi:ubiquinone/menaquinone biosynthesis C-methylase UbiE
MLERAREKLSSFRKSYDLVLGDGACLPFVAESFDALICMSTMHYFDHQGKIMNEFSGVMRKHGVFVCGDLTVHESDEEGFFERLERTVSKAHAGYCKPSEARKLLETCGFRVSRMNTFAYRKLHRSLMEDKGKYFGVPPEALDECLHYASAKSRKLYGITDTELTLYYTVIAANKQSQ